MIATKMEVYYLQVVNEHIIVAGGNGGMVHLINALTLAITQTFKLNYDVREIKQTSKEWVFATAKGITFIKYDKNTNLFDQTTVESYLQDKNVYSVQEFKHNMFLVSYIDYSGIISIFDRKRNSIVSKI